MATTKTARRNVRNTRTGSNAMNFQKMINEDFALLWKDYGKLGVELWRMPLTKFIVGGAAIGALVPVLMKVFDEYDMDTIKEKITDFVHTAKDETQDLTE